VRSNKGVLSTTSSYRAIERWFAPEDGSAGQAFEKNQPPYSVLANLVNHGVSRGSSLRNVLALRMWLAQHNAELPVKLRDDDWGVPSWHGGGMYDHSVDMDGEGEGEGEGGVLMAGGGAAGVAKRSASKSPPRAHADAQGDCDDDDDDDDDWDVESETACSGMMPADADSAADSIADGTSAVSTPNAKGAAAEVPTAHKRRRNAPVGPRKSVWRKHTRSYKGKAVYFSTRRAAAQRHDGRRGRHR
jgi:hypothetical protein